DSTRVAAGAVTEAREYIKGRWGADYMPRSARAFRTKAKGAQEAHEAIRPTAVAREPERLRPYLNQDQYRLYDLIWKRMVASQMAAAGFDTLTVEITADDQEGGRQYRLRASSTQLRFPGFLALYSADRDEDDQQEPSKAILPDLVQGEALDLHDLFPEQHFTQPPPWYTDASLIKELEARGIGRPSTYAPILGTLQERGYVRRAGRHLEPEELGIIVCDLLVQHFPNIVDEKFTATMEEDLDQIAAGERDWVPVLREFYAPLAEAVQEARERMQAVRVEPEPAGEDCTLCGRPMVIRTGRYGRFIACSGFPECRNTKPILTTIGVPCPQCGQPLVERRTKRRRTFFGCSSYPECTFTTWERPLPEPCPVCGGLLVRSGVDRAKCLKCGATQTQAPPRPSARARKKEPVAARR
ncbi:MAG: type I DNA topoisomerase, partial [Chloroflexi bacterium]|nr:type I DNA topoisomerase [Chloroflexota bacterium]